MNKLFILPIFAIIPLLITGAFIYDSENNFETQANEGLVGTGHFTITVTDQFGVVKAYQQSDNAIVNTGENCVAKMMFGSDGGDQTGNGVCVGEISQGFRYMGLDEDAQVLVTDKDLRDIADSAGLSALQKCDITWNQNSTASTDALSKVTIRQTCVFTNSGADEDIFAVGLFNDTSASTRSMLAKANFTQTTVTTGSDVTINYDIEVGGGTVP